MLKSNSISLIRRKASLIRRKASLIDTHSHLFWDSFEPDFEDVVKRSIEAGVNMVINVGVDVKLSKNAAGQAKKQARPDFKIYSSIGIHPEEAIKYFGLQSSAVSNQLEIDIEELKKIYLKNRETIIAVGECGLDFAYFNRKGYLPEGLSIEKAKDLQRELFKAQIDLAKKLNLPLLIHCRDDRSQDFQNTQCWDEIIELTKDHFGIYHCYSGLLSTTNSILQNTRFLVSFAGNLTYPKNDYLKEAVKILPMERIVLETDCPFLPPQSIRGKRNEPSSVKEIALTIAELKNTPFEKVAEITTGNFKEMFRLKTVN